jgi:hypothetical protein
LWVGKFRSGFGGETGRRKQIKKDPGLYGRITLNWILKPKVRRL